MQWKESSQQSRATCSRCGATSIRSAPTSPALSPPLLRSRRYLPGHVASVVPPQTSIDTLLKCTPCCCRSGVLC